MKGSTENQRHAEAMRAVPPPIQRIPPGTLPPIAFNVATVDDHILIQVMTNLIIPAEQAEQLIETLKRAVAQAKDKPIIEVARAMPFGLVQ